VHAMNSHALLSLPEQMRASFWLPYFAEHNTDSPCCILTRNTELQGPASELCKLMTVLA
jgi:hypothetical protein